MRGMEALAGSLSSGFRDDFDTFRAVVDVLPVAIYTTDAAGKITYYNAAAADFWGCEPEIGQSEWCGSWKLYLPDGTPLPNDECPMAVAIREQRPVRDVEAVAERPDGSRVPFLPYPTPLFDDAGSLIGAVNMLVDISGRKASEAALQLDITQRRAAEETLAERAHEQAALYQFTDSLRQADSPARVYEYAFDAIRDGLRCDRAAVLLCDDAGVMRFVAWRGLSDDYRRAVDGHSPWPRDAVDPQPVCFDDIAQSDLPDDLKQTVLREGIAAVAFIPLVSGRDLVGKFMAYYREPHVFSSEQVDLATTIARQLSFGIARVRADDARRLAEDKLRHFAAIVESSDDAIISKDLNSTIQSWNRGAERIFGYTAEEAVGQPIWILFPEDRRDEENQILDRIRRGERVEHYETIRRTKNGKLVNVSLTVSPVKDSFGRVVGASKIARDVSERQRADEQRELLVAELSHRVKNTLATVISIEHQSFSKAPSVDDARRSFTARIRALAQTHGRLADGDWSGVSLEATFQDELAPYALQDGSNVRVFGPPITLTPKGAVTLGMAIHELATNAAKYGALSVKDGLINVYWQQDPADHKLHIRWIESGGPEVAPPKRSGFGRVLLERALASDLQGEVALDFAPAGLQCTITLPINDNAIRSF